MPPPGTSSPISPSLSAVALVVAAAPTHPGGQEKRRGPEQVWLETAVLDHAGDRPHLNARSIEGDPLAPSGRSIGP